MNNIDKIDTNFKVETKLGKEGIRFYNVLHGAFKIHGVFMEGGKFRRMPEVIASTVSEGVQRLHSNTAGGRVRFKTNSTYVAISAKMEAVGKMPHFALTGSAGFDLYEDNVYKKTFVPPYDIEDGYESLAELESADMREITINFPLYSDVKELYIGIDENAEVLEPSPYANEAPVVYYGSSITQGGCASRPGSSYQSIVSRRCNLDFVNLGFSGNAKAEDEMIDYIKNLDMSIFVLDYDHNAPTIEHLRATHEKLFKAVRSQKPDMPIIMMSRPKHRLTEDEKERRHIVQTTYNNAIMAGDKNVYFIDGEALTELCGNDGTVDNCHPTDFGFASMAKAVGDVISKIIV